MKEDERGGKLRLRWCLCCKTRGIFGTVKRDDDGSRASAETGPFQVSCGRRKRGMTVLAAAIVQRLCQTCSLLQDLEK